MVSEIEFEKALYALELALAEPKSDIVRDATIQRFEFCAELAWKVAKKKMGTASGAPKTVVREMAQSGLIDDPGYWIDVIDERNKTSQTYNESLADEVYEFAKHFLPHAKDLLARLKTL